MAEAGSHDRLGRRAGPSLAGSCIPAVLVLFFVLQLSLAPFDFFSGSNAAARKAFFVTSGSPSAADVVGNIALYFPVGVMLHRELRRRTRLRRAALPVTIALAAGLSAAVEWSQAYSLSRVSSLIDWIANLAGGALGAGCSLVCARLLQRLEGAVMGELRERPIAVLVKGYCGLLVIMAVLPLSFAFDTGRLSRCWRAAEWRPFASIASLTAAEQAAVAASDHTQLAYWRWARLKRLSRWAVEGLSFGVLAIMMVALFRSEYRFGLATSAMLAGWIGGGLAVGLSLLQLPLITRTLDSTDILFRFAGLGMGVIAAPFVRGRADQRRNPQFMRAGLVFCTLYILHVGLIPFEWDSPDGSPPGLFGSEAFLPFASYATARLPMAMDDAMEKIATYCVFAALLVAACGGLHESSRFLRLAVATAAGVVLSSVIELIQMPMSVRVATLTDPILAAFGCTVGVLAWEYASALVAVSRWQAAGARSMMLEAEAELSEPIDGPVLHGADAALASLADAHPQAPKEPAFLPQAPAERLR